jgi:DNA modification methylase
MSLAPGSHHPDVWHDVNRMLTLNGDQSKRGLAQHICPLQFDIVDRIINRYTNPGELVFDPFGGIMTVPYRAIKLGRYGKAVELCATYFKDGLRYLREAELKRNAPTLFDLLPTEEMVEA